MIFGGNYHKNRLHWINWNWRFSFTSCFLTMHFYLYNVRNGNLWANIMFSIKSWNYTIVTLEFYYTRSSIRGWFCLQKLNWIGQDIETQFFSVQIYGLCHFQALKRNCTRWHFHFQRLSSIFKLSNQF